MISTYYIKGVIKLHKTVFLNNGELEIQTKLFNGRCLFFKMWLVFTFEQKATAGPNPLVHVNPKKMYTKPIEYEYKT